MSTMRRSFNGYDLLLMAIAFLSIFVYGLLTALPGTVLDTLKTNKYLPNDALIGTFLLINAAGAVLSYLVSGPVTDRIGKKFTLSAGAALVILAMTGLALIVTKVEAASALALIFACSLVLGLGANAIVSAGHAVVADVAAAWRNAALNLLDVFFGLGLMTLPLLISPLNRLGGLSAVFWSLAIATGLLLVIVLAPRFPKPTHPESFPFSEAKHLFKNASFWLLAVALFMYVGAEVAVGKWVVTFMQHDKNFLPAILEQDINIVDYSLKTLSLFGLALITGRLLSSFLLGVRRMNSFVLLALGSAITSVALAIAFTNASPVAVRWAVFVSGVGMGPVFPTSVGLASMIAPRISGTAMSWVMGIGFAGLLVIPPAVGYISNAVGGEAGDVRTGLLVVLAASVIMTLLHIVLAFRERRRAVNDAALEMEAAAKEA